MAAPIRQLFPDEGPPPEEAPNPVEVLPGPTAPLDVARVVLAELVEDGQTLLRRWRGGWWRWQRTHWAEAEPEAVRKYLYLRTERASYMGPVKGSDQLEAKPWAPNKGKIDQLVDAMTAPTLLPAEVEAPSWLDTGASGAGIVACRNGLVDVETQKLHPPTPRYFGTTSVPFDYDPEAPAPEAWLGFLRSIWPLEDGREAEEVLALQEWFGYVLSGRMDLQKILLVVGPPRSGKSTIARVLQGLMGKANVAHPTLASLATNFGLAPLLGRPLAIVGDARLQAQGQETVVERLLSISGEDSLTVDRKNRDAWHGRIPARLMVVSNELPRFGDASGAIAARFVVLTLRETFLGREDIGLGARLDAELPGILRWGLDGMARLNGRGRFTEPAASVEAVQALADLVSPISAFVREVCVTGSQETAQVADLYRQYSAWCDENGRGTSSVQKLSSDLRTILPTLSVYRPKVGGVAQPRQFRGLGISAEWRARERETADEWRRG